jgi:anti-anti-sigma factor
LRPPTAAAPIVSGEMRPMPDGRVLSHLITEGTYLVSAGDELVGEPGASVAREIEHLVDRGAREVVVDLGDVTFVDAAAVAALVSAGKRARGAGALVTLVVDDANVLRILDLVGVRRIVVLADSVTAAFAGVAARAGAGADATSPAAAA